MVPWVYTAEERFSSLSLPLYAKQKGARADTEQLAHSDVPQWSWEEIWVWHWGHRGHWHCHCLLTLCGDAALLLPAVPHKPTDSKTHPCPNPHDPSSPSSPLCFPARCCPEGRSPELSWSLITCSHQHWGPACCPSSHHSVLTWVPAARLWGALETWNPHWELVCTPDFPAAPLLGGGEAGQQHLGKICRRRQSWGIPSFFHSTLWFAEHDWGHRLYIPASDKPAHECVTHMLTDVSGLKRFCLQHAPFFPPFFPFSSFPSLPRHNLPQPTRDTVTTMM